MNLLARMMFVAVVALVGAACVGSPPGAETFVADESECSLAEVDSQLTMMCSPEAFDPAQDGLDAEEGVGSAISAAYVGCPMKVMDARGTCWTLIDVRISGGVRVCTYVSGSCSW